MGRKQPPTEHPSPLENSAKDPFTIIDLIENETIDESIAAYLWLLMENKMSLMIIGATGAGKTTALNAIACLIQPSYKVISVEEVGEINLPLKIGHQQLPVQASELKAKAKSPFTI
ncbi:MAG: ATPase, T2SS/T4P/T4SS family [Candidatus Bathyarchaeia archaeon]|nr:ATPase, T2SS/T4P/T4SS family [Candidatus Bathyarchaeia archaeon]